jgi:hypothetical protein
MCIFMGVFPNVFLRPMEASVNRVIERVHSRQAARVQAAPAAAARREAVTPAPTADND